MLLWSFLLLHALPSAGQAAAQEAYKFKVDAFLLPTPHFLYMTKAAYRYADSLSKSADIREFVEATGCAVNIIGSYDYIVKQGEKPNTSNSTIRQWLMGLLGNDKGDANQPRIGVTMLWKGLNEDRDDYVSLKTMVSAQMKATPTVGSYFPAERVKSFTNAIGSYTDTSLNIAESRADQHVIEELEVLQKGAKKGKETSLPYLPWMNYAIAEAKTMDGISECEDPLFSKGKEYHLLGGGQDYCPCGQKNSTNYCEINSWCASFANWCLRKSNTAYTKSAGSQTFLKHSEFVKISEPVFGAIAVFTNLDGNGNFKTSGHVAFVVGTLGKNYILCLGGNQSDKIKVTKYPLSQNKIQRTNQSFFRGYYIPRAYSDKLKNYRTDITNYTDEAIANQQIINLNINSTENESTR